ncbi:MATE family efflux transporter [Parabacteroides sp. Marseille-P3160]|uniref:MATE family efflux transporter n=1 Tax=Parabacteroides sp. Marseille-P3160 TaxID=1917887 RepID=UPI0009BB80C0|nr:MATE family efflux transporter [Parabacteroides sp. Marseille-P3160]
MNKKILRLALPNIISNITVPLLGVVDLAIVGHLEVEQSIGGISLATMIVNFIYWNFAFLRMGTSGFTAQSYGARNLKEATAVLFRSMAIAMLASGLILLFHRGILELAFHWIETSETVRSYTKAYFNIYIWAAPAILGQYALTGWLIGMQNAKTPMFVAIFVNVLNICLSFFFVYGLGMQIEGVAMASLIAQTCGFLYALLIFVRCYGRLRSYWDWSVVKRVRTFAPFFRVNSDIFMRTLLLVCVTTFFTSASASLGDTILAVNTLLMQFFIFFSYMMDGFAYAAEALAGRYVGARDPLNLYRLVRQLFRWGLAVALLFTLLYGLFTEEILGILTDKANVILASRAYRHWVLLIPMAGFAAFLWDGIFIGATASRQMRNSMLVAAGGFFLLYALLSACRMPSALWISFLCYLALRGGVQTMMAKSVLSKSISTIHLQS